MKKLMMVAVVAMTAVVAWAETISFSYQGALANADGSAITGDKNKTIQFRLYAGPTDETVLWGRSVSVRLDDNGFFNVELSDGAGSAITGENGANLDQILAANAGKLYIGLTVDGSTGEIRPRQKVLSVPSAAYAEDVANAKKDFTVAGNAFVTGGLTVDGPMEAKNGLAVNQISVGSGGITLGGTMNVASGTTLKLAKGAKISDAQGKIDLIEQASPKGIIVMWSGAADAIPAGWALCNGANGTPDLRGRFIVGAGTSASDYDKNSDTGVDRGYDVAAKGGKNEVALTTQEMPTHYHIYLSDNRLAKYFDGFKDSHPNIGYYALPDNKNGSWLGGASYDWSGDEDMRALATGNAGGAAEHGGDWNTAGTIGEADAHENRPPYYALCFIMKL